MMKKIRMTLIAVGVLAVVVTLIFPVRQTWAKQQVKRAWMAPVPEAPPLATTERLDILPLYEEASVSGNLISGHGVSYLIRTDASTILLDLGNDPEGSEVTPFIQNVEALDISREDLNAVFITHLHPDHVGGGKAWFNNTLSLNGAPEAWADLPVYVPAETAHPSAILSHDPTLIASDVGTTGVLPYVEVFLLSLFEATGGEQALVLHVANEGLVLVTGCGHPGLTNLVIRAQTLYQEPVVGVVGGLHYGDAKAKDVAGPIAFLQSRGIRLVAMSPHDSGSGALAAFEAAFAGRYHTLRVGETVRFP